MKITKEMAKLDIINNGDIRRKSLVGKRQSLSEGTIPQTQTFYYEANQSCQPYVGKQPRMQLTTMDAVNNHACMVVNCIHGR